MERSIPDFKSDPKKDKLDLFNNRIIRSFFRSKHYPFTFQIFLVFTLVYFVYLGVTQPEGSSFNPLGSSLSGLFWYGIIFVSLFFLGRMWCAVCPVGAIAGAFNKFTLGLQFPRKLSNYGLALLSFLIPLWVIMTFGWDIIYSQYEAALWLTGFIIIAIALSLLFKGRVFCKYVCPITAPLAVMARVAPIELRTSSMATTTISSTTPRSNSTKYFKKLIVLQQFNPSKKTIDSTCKECKTHDCAKGNEETEGCPWDQHPAVMQENSSCSLCMKCTHSCPSTEPMRLRLRIPFSELWPIFRPNIYEAFTILSLVGIYAFYRWEIVFDQYLFHEFSLQFITAIQSVFPYLSETQVTEGFFSFVIPVAFVVPLYAVITWVSSRLVNQDFKENFASFAYAYLPVVFLGLIGDSIITLLSSGYSFIPIGFHSIGIDFNLSGDLFDTNNWVYWFVQYIPGTIISLPIGILIVFKIAHRKFKNDTRKVFLSALPHVSMVASITLFALLVAIVSFFNNI